VRLSPIRIIDIQFDFEGVRPRFCTPEPPRVFPEAVFVLSPRRPIAGLGPAWRSSAPRPRPGGMFADGLQQPAIVLNQSTPIQRWRTLDSVPNDRPRARGRWDDLGFVKRPFDGLGQSIVRSCRLRCPPEGSIPAPRPGARVYLIETYWADFKVVVRKHGLCWQTKAKVVKRLCRAFFSSPQPAAFGARELRSGPPTALQSLLSRRAR